MKTSQLIVNDETCVSNMYKTPVRPSFDPELSPPSRQPGAKKQMRNPNIKNVSAQVTSPEGDLTGNQGFWIKFAESTETCDEDSVSSGDSFLSDDVSDDFFEFEVDEHGNWSSVSDHSIEEDGDLLLGESTGTSGAQKDVESFTSQKCEFKNDSAFCTNDTSIEHNKVDIPKEQSFLQEGQEKMSKKKSLNKSKSLQMVEKLTKPQEKDHLNVSSMKNIESKGLVNKLKNINRSLIFDFCKKINLIVG